MLLKPAIAGIAVHTSRVRDDDAADGWRTVRTENPATWPAILEPDRWEQLRDKLTDPGRRTSPGNEPRWLVSLYALCGVCADGTTCRVTGGSVGHNRPSYACSQRGHLRRHAPALDAYIAGLTVERLSRPDVASLLRPPPRPGTNTRGLRAEARKLRDRKRAQMRLHAAGAIDDDDLATGMKEIRDRLAAIGSQLAAATEPDPLAEFRDRPAAAVWAALPLPRKRAVVKLLMRVTILPATRHAPASTRPASTSNGSTADRRRRVGPGPDTGQSIRSGISRTDIGHGGMRRLPPRNVS